jgi:hypothetical protein
MRTGCSVCMCFDRLTAYALPAHRWSLRRYIAGKRLHNKLYTINLVVWFKHTKLLGEITFCQY